LHSWAVLYRRGDDQPPDRRRWSDESQAQIRANGAVGDVSDCTFEIEAADNECLRRIGAREAHIADRRPKAIKRPQKAGGRSGVFCVLLTHRTMGDAAQSGE
jgi:hypothetical protein